MKRMQLDLFGTAPDAAELDVGDRVTHQGLEYTVIAAGYKYAKLRNSQGEIWLLGNGRIAATVKGLSK